MGILACIWVLCYRAESQLPERHLADIYARFTDRGVSPQSLAIAQNIARGANDANYPAQQK